MEPEVYPIEKNEEPKQHWYDGFVRIVKWYPSSLPKEEKKLLFKIDTIILTYICCSYFTKSLDKSNITNAYVTGMREAIGFDGNNLSYAKSIYSAGYIVSMCFGTLFVTRSWARLMLPILELIWGVLTFCEAAAKNPSQMLALRFLIGLTEGPVFPSVVFILGSWYKRDELFRRVTTFSISSGLGSMFSGYLQSAAYANLDGKYGLQGWQWGFIIDGIVTVPIALYGLIMFPGTPSQVNNIFWMKKQELELAFGRMEKSGVAKPEKLTWKVPVKVFTNKWVHFFATFWVLLNVVALPEGQGFQLWLDDNSPERFTQAQVNNYPTIQNAIGIVAQIICGGLSDTFSFYPFLAFVQVTYIVCYSSLAAWNIADGWRWVCFMIIGFDGVDQAIISGWINRTCRKNANERSIVLAYSDAVSQAINIWTNIVFFPTDHAPRFQRGYIAATVGAFLMLLLPYLGKWMEGEEEREDAPISAGNNDDSNNIGEKEEEIIETTEGSSKYDGDDDGNSDTYASKEVNENERENGK